MSTRAKRKLDGENASKASNSLSPDSSISNVLSVKKPKAAKNGKKKGVARRKRHISSQSSSEENEEYDVLESIVCSS